MTLVNSVAATSPPQHSSKGKGGGMDTIFQCLQEVFYDLTMSLNIFCEEL